ncbi:MAG: zinc ribbon domain-containing protein [Saprospiraceae bacterium]
MRNCLRCNSTLPSDALFCHDCGAKQSLLIQACTHCGKRNERDSNFCIHCGHNTDETSLEEFDNNKLPTIYSPKYPLDFAEAVRLPVQLRTYFLKTVRECLEEMGQSGLFDEYVDTFYETDFLDHFDEAAKGIAEQSYLLQADQSPNAARLVDQYLTEEFEKLMAALQTKEGSDLSNSSNDQTDNSNPTTFDLEPNEEEKSVANQQIGDLILDELKLTEEQEKWYADLDNMPETKLRNAFNSFLKADVSERIFLICDQTVFGSCREGFALTDRALYWKAHFNKSQKIYYNDISSVELSEEWLIINGKFFNASPAINVKMMHLLEKLGKH